jgi:hypothetical protein
VPTDATEQQPGNEPGQRQLAALDLPMVPFVVGGLIVWLILAIVLAAFHTSLDEQGRGEWVRICFAGFLVGLPGLALMIVHDRNRRLRRAARTE